MRITIESPKSEVAIHTFILHLSAQRLVYAYLGVCRRKEKRIWTSTAHPILLTNFCQMSSPQLQKIRQICFVLTLFTSCLHSVIAKTATRWVSFLPRTLGPTTSAHWDYCVRGPNINSSVSLQDGWLALKGPGKNPVLSFGAPLRRRLLN